MWYKHEIYSNIGQSTHYACDNSYIFLTQRKYGLHQHIRDADKRMIGAVICMVEMEGTYPSPQKDRLKWGPL